MSFSTFLPNRIESKKRKHDSDDEAVKAFIDFYTTDYKRHRTLFFQLGQFQIISKSKQISTKDFKNRINRALDLLKNRAPQYYGLLKLFNKKIRAIDEYDGALAELSENSIDIGWEMVVESSDVELASTIIHELMHFWQFEAAEPFFYKFDKSIDEWICSNQKMELNSFGHELEVLRLIGGSESEIKRIERQRGTHWQAPQNYRC